MHLKVGDKIPSFSLKDQNGNVRNPDQLNKPLVLFFYPKDDTPGCTLESKDFSNLNKIISKSSGNELMSSYKRASNILESELKEQNLDLSNKADPGVFKTDFEKNLFKKINHLRKYFSSLNKDEVYSETLDNLLDAKKVINEFFDNVIVNDVDPGIRKNRLELIQILCKTFNNYINFSLVETQKWKN